MAEDPRCDCCDFPIEMCLGDERRSKKAIDALSYEDEPGSFLQQVASRLLGGMWMAARYNGSCSTCSTRFVKGDDIRADGGGGWQARCCDDA